MSKEQEQTQIQPQEADKPEAPGTIAEQEAAIAAQLGKQRKVRIVITSGKTPSERCPVPIGINGREFLIERDKEVDVPEGVLNVLDLAVASVGETQFGDRSANTEFHQAQRFGYKLLGFVNPQTGKLERT